MTIDDRWERHCALYSEADTLYRSGRLKEARALFVEALALWPGDSDTLWAIGSCFSELGDPWQAERCFRRALAVGQSKERGHLLYNIANALFDQKRFVSALHLYARVPRGSSAFELATRNARLCRNRLARRSRLRRIAACSQVVPRERAAKTRCAASKLAVP
jgi:tetratricopeptide (TPR) repeat protein